MKNIIRSTKKNTTLILCIGILLLALIVYLLEQLSMQNGATVKVSINGEEYGSYDLHKDQDIRIQTETGYNVLHIKDGMASVTEADCENQVCVHSGQISKQGQTIVCLPHKVVVLIENKEKSEVDAVTN